MAVAASTVGTHLISLALPNGSLTVKCDDEHHFVAEIIAQPGFSPTAHIHRDDEELFYVVEGHLDFLINDRVVHADAGTFLAVPPGTMHDFHNPGPKPARLLGIATPGRGFGDYFAEVSRQWTTGILGPDSLQTLRRDTHTHGIQVRWHRAAHES